VAGHPHPVVRVHTESGDEVYMTIADRAYQNFELVQKVDRLRQAKECALSSESLTFPMIDYDSEKTEPVDLSWLVGMHTTTSAGQGAFISKIMQQTKYKKNHLGARIKSSVAGSVTITSMRQPELQIVIDKPYLEWHIRPGAPFPTFQAYWTPEDWKNPGNLDF